MINDRELLAEFVVESKEHLQGVESQLLAIEASGTGAQPELIHQVFRAVHSIKGATGFLGLTTLGRLAHEMENVLNQVRKGQLAPDRTTTDALLQAADRLRGLLEDVEHSNEQDVRFHVDRLGLLLTGPVTAASPPALAAAAGSEVAGVPCADSPAQDSPPAATPNVAELPPEIPPAAAAPSSAPAAQVSASSSSGSADSSIRVSVTVLDRLMNLAGELVLARNQLLQIVNAKDAQDLHGVAGRLNQVTSELQETIMRARMQEIGTVFNKFPRMVRDMSMAMEKQCDLKLEGTSVELDKSIIEAIGDPLTHLIRNALDHGIEHPDVRQKARKSARGTLMLQAFHQAGKVNILVRDDGAGIDVARLREKAVSRGLINAQQAREMSNREAMRLVFRPGLSTAEKVTDVSGRGVGMDVVKTNIERLGGSVEVESELGAGTTVHIKLPLTLAIIPSLIIRCGNDRFAIPQASISELTRVMRGEESTKIQRVKNAEVLRRRGALLPLVRLSRALDLPGAQEKESCARAQHIVVVETGHLRYGLAVDGLHDSEEIVVKPLGRHMRGCHYLAGATILGDGNAALILDPAGLAAHCHLTMPEEENVQESTTDSVFRAGQEQQTMLMFRTDPAEQFAIPMQLITRLERIRSSQIDSVGGRRVLQYRGGSLPLVSLEDHIEARPMPPAEWLYVVVYSVGEREVGLLIGEVVDVVSMTTEIDTTIFRRPGVIGSVVVEGKATRLLDLYELTAAAQPNWVSQAGGTRSQTRSKATILLVEDSDFFRNRLSEMLEDAGYRVVGCPDGATAWATLQDSAQSFDLVVTDLQMPNVDGFELARKIRASAGLARMPIIAVTSLASDKDERLAAEVGIDEYHIKLDRERLLATITNYVERARNKEIESVRV